MQGRHHGASDLAALAKEWIAAWNSHDLERILALYSDDSEMTSAIHLRKLLVEDSPTLQGYDEAEFARRLHYDVRPIGPSLAALRAALKEGVIGCVASDHAPHAYDAKEAAFDDAPFGIIGLETAFAVAYTELVEGGLLTLPELIARMSTAPAKLLGLAGGTLSPAAPADVVVLDVTARWKVDPTLFFSKSRNTPFAGRALAGRAALTLVGGKVVHEAEAHRAPPAPPPP